MRALLTSFERRWRRRSAEFAPLRWQTCLFLTANIVLLSALLLDRPVGAGRNHTAPAVHFLGKMLTDFGASGWIILASLFLFIEGWAGSLLLKSPRCRCHAVMASRIGGYVLVSIAVSGLAANILKRVIGRARPSLFDDWGPFGFAPFSSHAVSHSFPSGHATTVGAFFAAMIFLFPRYGIVFVVCAIWLAATRVMIGAHYPSDVIAGLVLGAWFSFMTAIVYSRYGLLFKTAQSGWPVPRLPLLRK
jgi:membrane-associated phospholipid phosphatase